MRALCVLAAAVVLCSCAPFAQVHDTHAALEPAVGPVPTTWQLAQARVGDVEIGWAAQIGDAQLLELMREAQANNRDLKTVLAGVQQARALVRRARAALLPAINYSSGASQGGPVDGRAADGYAAGLSLGLELDVWGRVRATRNAAAYSAAAVEADYVFAQYSLAAAVAQTYFQLIEAGLQEEVARKSLNALAATERIVSAQRTLGAADGYDEALAMANLASARATLAQATGSKRLARRALEVLVGRYPANTLDVRRDLPAVPPLPSAGLPSALLERRPDLVAAERNVAAAFNRIGAARATRLPTFSLSGSLDTQALNVADALDPGNGVWSLATSLLGPLFDAGLRRAQIEEATAVQQQAINAYAQAALNAFGEVENRLDQNRVVAERVAALATAAAAQNRAFELAKLRYQAGETLLLDVFVVQANTLAADAALVTAQREQLDEWVALNLALGGGWAPP